MKHKKVRSPFYCSIMVAKLMTRLAKVKPKSLGNSLLKCSLIDVNASKFLLSFKTGLSAEMVFKSMTEK